MSEGFFRSKKGFTVVQNEITRDSAISLKAKGLYLVIQAYITMPDKQWTKDDFKRLAKEGSKAFESAWQELKDNGYLKVHCLTIDGKWRTEYELLDAPEAGAHTFYHNSAGEITSDNIKRAAKKQLNQMEEQGENSMVVSEETEQQTKENNRYPLFGSNGAKDDRYPPFGSNGNGSNGNGSNGNGCNGNGGNKKNKDLVLKPSFNDCNISPNLNPNPAERAEVYSMEFVKRHFKEKDLILMGLEPKDVEMVIEILYDTLNSSKERIWVNREQKAAAVVKSRLLKLNCLDIEYAISQYQKQTTEIRHHKAYMLSVLYDAKGQANLDFTNRVQHDMYGGY